MSHRWGGARTQYAWKYPAPSAMNKTSCFSLPGGNHWAAVWRLFFFLWCLLNFYADSHPNGSGLIINQPGLGLDFFFFFFSGGNRCQGHTFKFLDTKMVRWEDVSLIFISFTEGWRDGGRRLQGMRTQHGWKQMKLWLICLMYMNPPHTHTHIEQSSSSSVSLSSSSSSPTASSPYLRQSQTHRGENILYTPTPPVM